MGARIEAIMIKTQHVNAEGADADREEIARKRADQIKSKQNSLLGREKAANIRGDAQDTQTACQAGSSAIAAAGAIAAVACACAAVPIVGAIIAAVVAIIAAIILLVAHLKTKGEEQKAAMKDKLAGLEEMDAEKSSGEIDDCQEQRRETRQKFQNDLQTFLQQEGESREIQREVLRS